MITLKRATPEAVRYACLNYHYAKRVPTSRYSYNVYNDAGEWCGVVIYGPDASPYLASSNGFETGEILELVRVALNGKQPCTSMVVAETLKQIHKDAPEVKAIISFADMDEGHAGTIYQATNWIYLGIGGKRADGNFIINGKKYHNKSIHERHLSHEDLKKIDPDFQMIRANGKHKYIFVFNKKLRKEQQKKALPYPKKPCGSSSTVEHPAILREGGGSTPTLTLQ